MTQSFSELFEEGYRARREHRLAASRAIFIDGVRKASEAGDRPALAEALSGLAAAEDQIGNCAAAQHHYANAALLYRDIGPPELLARAVAREANLLAQMNHLAEAEPLYIEAEKIYRQNGEESALELAATLRALAQVKEATGEAQAAVSLLREACEIYVRRNVAEEVAECGKKLSQLTSEPD